MTDIHTALENLTDAYLARGDAQARVRAKYANYERELAEARQEDIDTVAAALAAAWDAGASVAASGRAMGASNIYNSRRAYYDRAKELQGEAAAEDNDFLETLYQRVRGGEITERHAMTSPEVRAMQEDAEPAPEVSISNYEEWVGSWHLSPVSAGTWEVLDPANKVASINLGKISGHRGRNLGEFIGNRELHDVLYRLHPETAPDYQEEN